MNRREALSKIVLMMGATLSASTLSAMSRFQHPDEIPLKLPGTPLRLTDNQRAILAEVAERILPKTDTPGAKDAGVPDFIEMMIRDCYKKIDQDSFAEGLADLEKRGFLGQNVEGQNTLLKAVESETEERMKAAKVKQVKVGDNVDKETMETKKGVPFWRLAKELTLLGYFTSEVGMKASFIYEPIPGKFEVLTNVAPGQKAYAH